MLLSFVDESNHGDFHGFAALVAGAEATRSITNRLNSIMLQVSVDFGIPKKTEIHAHPVFHGKEAWSALGARARVGLFEKVLDAVVTEDMHIVLRSVSESRLRARQSQENYPVQFPPEQVCFQHILQRVNGIAARERTYALMIADERGDRERHRDRFATYQTQGTPGVYMHTTLPKLLDTVHFAPSHHSRMLQAVDVLAFVYRRRQTVTESDPRAAAAMDRLWSKITATGRLYDCGQWP
ncbi:DUF3800 domain-containing protein [Aeromicrobium sp. JJY06]|uniref:DUF3800 domain-containing protein n=1 Tax=Aeromicrobium sp. JJY06 TaxID=3373478 RepID=UPI00376EC60F